MASDSEDDQLAQFLAEDPGQQRATTMVGSWVPLPALHGQPVGDDVSWKGSQVTRLVALQAAGVGSGGAQFGEQWAVAISGLGADIAVISESRISSPEIHRMVQAVFLAKGYLQ